MTTLILQHGGWEVATAAWTAAAKPGRSVSICYQWGADGISWFSSATGISRVTLHIDMADFLKLTAKGGLVDLRRYCGG